MAIVGSQGVKVSSLLVSEVYYNISIFNHLFAYFIYKHKMKSNPNMVVELYH